MTIRLNAISICLDARSATKGTSVPWIIKSHYFSKKIRTINTFYHELISLIFHKIECLDTGYFVTYTNKIPMFQSIGYFCKRFGWWNSTITQSIEATYYLLQDTSHFPQPTYIAKIPNLPKILIFEYLQFLLTSQSLVFFGSDAMTQVWRKTNTELQKCNIKPTNKLGVDSVIVRMSMSA